MPGYVFPDEDILVRYSATLRDVLLDVGALRPRAARGRQDAKNG